MATFADDGPTRCSGLEVHRYSPEALHAEFGAPFRLIASEREEHITPAGANFVHYDVAKVTTLYALEPNPEMLQLAERERRLTKLSVEFLDSPGERIPLGDSAVDTVVSTFTLCTIPAVVEAISGIARALKPGGRLIFLENSVAADPRVRRWQRWWEPIHHRVFGGLYLTRDIPALIAAGGLRIDRMTSHYLADFPKSWTSCCCGTAVRQP